MTVKYEALIAAANAARLHSYSPYSKFAVGAAVLTESGEVFAGCNVESASFPHGSCAERVAIGKAVSEGHRVLTCVVVVTPTSPPSAPCGGCRQFIYEFGPDAEVVCVNLQGETVVTTMATLLPSGFGGAALG